MKRIFKNKKIVFVNPGAFDDKSKEILKSDHINEPKFIADEILKSHITKTRPDKLDLIRISKNYLLVQRLFSLHKSDITLRAF